ncbi:MAG TPA: phenylalanine--tRNA ligase beta subunit-related protein [Candidatus Kapabacteria bacterium]|nr:phenylalanine--tRNA ligase beta subunit-related protein [Candidatus Kapabacteria bacterium]
MVSIDPHPLLHAAIFVAQFGVPLERLPSPAWLQELLRSDADVPVRRTEEVRQGVRSMLRNAGYKPTGRGKPASEYLVRAEEEGVLASINAAVDACNVVSLHSGLPISLVDSDRTRGPLRIGVAAEGASYIFNLSGQSIDLGGLLCLFDAEGPCANAVKDSQRTKTSGTTTRTLSIIWGVRGFEEHTASTERWYRSIVERLGGECG